VIGLAEVRWLGNGELTTDDGHKIWYMGEKDRHKNGVAFMVHKDSTRSVMECCPLNSRMISIRVAARPKNMTIIQVYAPTSDHTDEEIEEFYDQLEQLIAKTPKKDILIIQGDWNAKVGTDAYQDWIGTIGKYGVGTTNERGLRLLEFARLNDLVLANTLHPHKLSRRTTWHSPGGLYHNQIDYILMSKRFRSSINTHKTRTFPGADVGSDHDLVMMTIQLRLKQQAKSRNPRIKYDLSKLEDPMVREEFQAKIGG